MRTFVLRILLASVVATSAWAAEPVLRVTGGGVTQQFTGTDLLGRSDAATIDVLMTRLTGVL